MESLKASIDLIGFGFLENKESLLKEHFGVNCISEKTEVIIDGERYFAQPGNMRYIVYRSDDYGVITWMVRGGYLSYICEKDTVTKMPTKAELDKLDKVIETMPGHEGKRHRFPAGYKYHITFEGIIVWK